MHRLLTAFVIAPLAALAQAAPVPKGAKERVLYYATGIGAEWTYEVASREVVEVVTDARDEGTAKVITLARVDGGKRVPHQTLSVSWAGVFMLKGDGADLDPPLCLLKLPCKPGDTWACDFAPRGELGVAGRAEARGVEAVRVPAGEFRAVRVDRAYTSGGEPDTQRCWYAPQVGLVRMEDRGTVWVLKKFVPGRN